MRALDALGHALAVAGTMTWQITWSLILGFTLTAIIQALVRRQTITRLLGDDKPKTLALATGLGALVSAAGLLAVLVVGISAVHSGALPSVLLGALAFLFLAAGEAVVPLPADLQRRLVSPLKQVSDAFVDYLKAAAAGLRTSRLPPPISPVQAALKAYAAEVAAVRSEGLTRGVPGDVAERFFALGFSLEQMRQNLKDLERCVAAWADAPAVPGKEATDDAE